MAIFLIDIYHFHSITFSFTVNFRFLECVVWHHGATLLRLPLQDPSFHIINLNSALCKVYHKLLYNTAHHIGSASLCCKVKCTRGVDNHLARQCSLVDLIYCMHSLILGKGFSLAYFIIYGTSNINVMCTGYVPDRFEYSANYGNFCETMQCL